MKKGAQVSAIRRNHHGPAERDIKDRDRSVEGVPPNRHDTPCNDEDEVVSLDSRFVAECDLRILWTTGFFCIPQIRIPRL